MSGVSPLSKSANRPPVLDDSPRSLGIQIPVHDVERVLRQVGHLPARVVPEPSEMIDRPVGVVRSLGGRTEPEVVIEVRRRLAIGRRAEARA